MTHHVITTHGSTPTTWCAITYDWIVARWKPDARDRLARAAIELFNEQGFAATTVPQITDRAGLTTRTFYRHFADKREVLFGPEPDPETARAVLAQAPAGASTAELLTWGLRLLADGFEPYREQMRATQSLIASDPSLRERALRNRETLNAVIGTALRERGLDKSRARLLAEATVSALYLALEQWTTTDADIRVEALALQALAGLHADLDGIELTE